MRRPIRDRRRPTVPHQGDLRSRPRLTTRKPRWPSALLPGRTRPVRPPPAAATGSPPARPQARRPSRRRPIRAAPPPPTARASGVPKRALEDTTAAEPQPSRTIETAAPNVLNSESGSAPTEPTRDAPAISTLLAGARRELATESTVSSLISPQSLTPSSTAVQYAPTLDVTNNVITGTNTAATAINGNPITYYVVSAAADGGKMGIDSATGNFAVLPYQTALASGSETYSVLAAETTPFDGALTGIPIFGPALFLPVLLQLYQMPGLNVILAPVIGTSTMTPVSVTPSALNTTGNPLAFTTMVTSFDGTNISMNYFPSSGMTSEQTAPTIFNGSGAATPSIVNPYLPNPEPVQRLRGAGYNVVTWDPRGEYYSGGVLQLDSAQFEGRDVSAMIDYVADLSTSPTRLTRRPADGHDRPLLRRRNSIGDRRNGLAGRRHCTPDRLQQPAKRAVAV